MQREKSELLAMLVVDVERRVPVTDPREVNVVGHVGFRHYLAEFSSNLNALKRDERIVGLYLRVRRDNELSSTDQDEEDESSRKYEDEEYFTYASILHEANVPLLVERFW